MKIRDIIHKIYYAFGLVLSNIRLAKTTISDSFCPPKATSIVIVAHPDDETLFFYKYINNHHPYVVILSDGWSIRRICEFQKAMKRYDVRYRVYNMMTREDDIRKIEKLVRKALRIRDFDTILTHNSHGEYGHLMHKTVHEAVIRNAGNRVVLTPNQKCSERLSENDLKQKIDMFKGCYRTQGFVLDMYSTWVENESTVRWKSE